jgi:hypothetical protein
VRAIGSGGSSKIAVNTIQKGIFNAWEASLKGYFESDFYLNSIKKCRAALF